jgi:hypothetical protein
MQPEDESQMPDSQWDGAVLAEGTGVSGPDARSAQGICLDRAYDNAEARDLIEDYDLMPHIRAERLAMVRTLPYPSCSIA